MGSGIGKRAHEKAISALDRIQNLESGLENITNGIQQSFVIIEQRLQTVEEMLGALVNTVGAETVRDQVVAMRKAQMEARVEAAKASVKDAVDKQLLLVLEKLPNAAAMAAENADETLSKILVVGREIAADGTVVDPGRLQLPLSRILPEIRAKLADGTPGLIIETPNDRKFALDEVYIENPSPPAPAVEEAAPAAEAPPPAAEAAIEAEVAGNATESAD